MRLNQVHATILDELSYHVEGISFNRLASNLRGKISRVTLIRALDILAKNNIVSIEKDRFHRQKKIFKLSSKIKALIDEMKVHEEATLKDPVNELTSLIHVYSNKIRETRDDVLKNYLKLRLSKLVSNIILSIL